MGKKSQNLRRAGWEIISCWEGVYHKRIHGFVICFLVTAVLVSSPEFHTLSQTEWLVLLAMIWKSFGYRRSLWHLIKVLMFVDKNLYLYYFNWWYGRGHFFFWWEGRNYEWHHHLPPSFVFWRSLSFNHPFFEAGRVELTENILLAPGCGGGDDFVADCVSWYGKQGDFGITEDFWEMGINRD